MADRTPQEILLKLDELLHTSIHDRGDDIMDDQESEYVIQHEEFHKVTKELEPNTQMIVDQACKIINAKGLSTFKLCSIGCGDGRFDKTVLEGIIARKIPTLTHIDYLGIEIKSLSCQRNRERLSELQNVTVTVLNEDVQTMSATCEMIHEFDLVIVVHAFYYMQSPEKCLTIAANFMKESGMTLIINRDNQPLNELFNLFWLKSGVSITFTSSVIAALDSMKLKYTKKVNESSIDITQYVKDNFSLARQRQVLEFIVHANLRQYSSLVQEECIAFLVSIADGKPDHYCIKAFTDIITVTNNC